MVERYTCYGWDIRRGEMRRDASGDWVRLSDYEALERRLAEAKTAALTPADLAEALSCFWNAAIGEAHNKQDSTAFAVIGSVAEGIAAVERRLRELQEGKAG